MEIRLRNVWISPNKIKIKYMKIKFKKIRSVYNLEVKVGDHIIP